jgi:hypothetical protein
VGMALAVAYTVFNYRTAAGKISSATPGEHGPY